MSDGGLLLAVYCVGAARCGSCLAATAFSAESFTDGRKGFVFAHSEIFPGTYASTTECADYLLALLNLQRRAELRQGPVGMQQLSAVDAGRFHLRGYAGNSAPDHVDYLHAMPAWFSLFNFH